MLVVFWRYRDQLSLRGIAERFRQRGIVLTREAVRD
jgi:transposase-like protein